MPTKKEIKRLEKLADIKKLKAASDFSKKRDENRCVICGATKMLNAHHIIPREHKELRYNTVNLISLCPNHHQFSRQISAHNNSFAFYLWFQQYRPKQYAKLLERVGVTKEGLFIIRKKVNPLFNIDIK